MILWQHYQTNYDKYIIDSDKCMITHTIVPTSKVN